MREYGYMQIQENQQKKSGHAFGVIDFQPKRDTMHVWDILRVPQVPVVGMEEERGLL